MHLREVWHFHRPALAKAYLDTLNAGLVTSTTIFAPRRAGKTSFLLKDLAPAAARAGYCVVYADLWQTKVAPGLAIVRALEQALESTRGPAHVIARLRAPIKKIRAKAQLTGASVEGEVELGDGSKAQTEVALQIDALITALCKKKPVLLMIDEAQELARSAEHDATTTALRTSMTIHQARLRVVFTGSSRTQLARVFSNATAPLYSTGSAIADFPRLGLDFVEFIADQFERATKRSLQVDQAWAAFVAFHQQPEPFLIGIVSMVLEPDLSLADAMEHVAKRQALAENHAELWAGLDAVQKALVRMLAKDPGLKPFSKSVLRELRTAIGIDTLETTHVQRALSKLTGIVVKSPRDVYEFENEAFADWLRTLAD